MRRRAFVMGYLVCAALAVGAGVGACNQGRSGQTPGDVCLPGDFRCEENVHQLCDDDGNRWLDQDNCGVGELICISGDGCKTCFPNNRRCDGFDIQRCDPAGGGFDVIATCDGEVGDVCFNGDCINACDLAEQNRSYEGCEYYAVDLDNAVVANQGTAAAQQFSVVLSNSSKLTAAVRVEIYCTALDAANPAVQCTEGQTHVVDAFPLAPGGLKIVDLDAREVDGATSPELNDGPGTFRSMHAYRITSTAPLVAYQFNPLENVNVFSNDASLLLPSSAAGSRYMVLSWPQTLATTDDSISNAGIDLRAFLTIVGLHDDTTLTVRLSTEILGGADIVRAQQGDTLRLTLNKFEVINLETDDFNSDFTGTVVLSDEDKPVAVFTGSEASDVPTFDTFAMRSCCADHMEQQLFPESAFGTRFVAVKSPLRSKYVEEAGWDVALIPDEPEWWRIVATSEDTSIATNLPSPRNAFFLQRGESVIIKAERDFIVRASHPIAFGQFPGGQVTTGIPSTLPGGERPPGGDPSYILIPPLEQWRNNYLFLVPNKYAYDFLLLAVPASALLMYDDLPIDSVLPCEYEPIGVLPDGAGVDVEYQAVRCPLSMPTPGGPGLQDDGVHTIRTAGGDPFGLVVFGFDSFVSYGYPGGANVALINPQ